MLRLHVPQSLASGIYDKGEVMGVNLIAFQWRAKGVGVPSSRRVLVNIVELIFGRPGL